MADRIPLKMHFVGDEPEAFGEFEPDDTIPQSRVTNLETDLDNLLESGEAIYFLEDEDDPTISGYKVMGNPAQLTAKATVVQSTIINDGIVQTWITDAGLPGTAFIPGGTWLFKINGFKTGGSQEVRLYNEIYKRAEGGAETLLETTGNSIPLTDSEVDLPAFNVYIPALTLLSTDRIVTKTKMKLIGGGSAPTSVTVAFSGNTSARLSTPAQAVNASEFVKKTSKDFVRSGGSHRGGLAMSTKHANVSGAASIAFTITMDTAKNTGTWEYIHVALFTTSGSTGREADNVSQYIMRINGLATWDTVAVSYRLGEANISIAISGATTTSFTLTFTTVSALGVQQLTGTLLVSSEYDMEIT